MRGGRSPLRQAEAAGGGQQAGRRAGGIATCRCGEQSGRDTGSPPRCSPLSAVAGTGRPIRRTLGGQRTARTPALREPRSLSKLLAGEGTAAMFHVEPRGHGLSRPAVVATDRGRSSPAVAEIDPAPGLIRDRAVPDPHNGGVTSMRRPRSRAGRRRDPGLDADRARDTGRARRIGDALGPSTDHRIHDHPARLSRLSAGWTGDRWTSGAGLRSVATRQVFAGSRPDRAAGIADDHERRGEPPAGCPSPARLTA